MDIVLNADDFGWSDDTVASTIECLEAGLVTSTTIMIGMPATSRALTYARSHPEHEYGVHLLFVGDGSERPITAPALVPSLVNGNGTLLPTNVVRKRALLGRVPVEEIQRELEAQIDYVRSQGVPVQHVDSHRHLHKFAPFREALRRSLPRFGIRCVRNVQDVYLRRPVASPTYWVGPAWRRSLMKSFLTTDHFYMPTSAHDENWDSVVDHLPPGRSLEVGLHPGSEEPWRAAERRSLSPFVERARSAGHSLIPWSRVGS